MGNFKQVIVGAGLLTAAFFVGSHFHGNSVDPNQFQSAESLADEDLIWHSADAAAGASSVNPGTSQESVLEEWGAPPRRSAIPTIVAPLRVDAGASPTTESDRQVMPSFANERVAPDLSRAPDLNAPNAPASATEFSFPSRDGATAPGLAHQDGAAPHSVPLGSGVPAHSGSFQTPTVAGLAPLVARQQRQIQLVVDSFQLHQVRSGDTLTTIAQQYYGSPDYYLDVYLANQDVMSNPADLPTGSTIKIPELRRDR